ncbi:CBM35 domain-containing protein [Streptomyces sp. NPDC090306]|uniref:CBM35 domain-containing protein n=1 Tax=unclassified Streptomyces TaxID=2593676 RepID=UPI0036E202A6
MTPGNNGASTPEDDDPFGYLYADGQANGAQPPTGGGYGYPNSVSRVRTVGERRYGQQQAPAAPNGPQGQSGQFGPAVPPQQNGYGTQQTAGYGAPQNDYNSPNAHYAAPETLPGGPPAGRQSSRGGGTGGRRGPNSKGLLIGAVAVVAAVVIGISVAMLSGDSDDSSKNGDTAASAPAATPSAQPSDSGDSTSTTTEDLPKTDAKALQLAGGTATASDVTGAKSDGGVYVTGFNQVGASVTWNVNSIPKDGDYTLYVGYGVPGKDATATLTVNGNVSGSGVSMKNYAKAAAGDYAKGWTQTYNWVTLNKGTNTIKISCETGNQCDANLDQLWLVKGHVG